VIIRSPKIQDNFYVLDKAISENESLTWAARGLLIFLLGKPDNWEVSVAHLQQQTLKSPKPTKRDGIYNLLSELVTAGYVKRVAENNNGRFGAVNYLVSESPVNAPLTDNTEAVKTPLTPLPYPASPYPAETTLIRTEYKQELKEQISIDKKHTKKIADEFMQKSFNEFYSAYPKKIGRETALNSWRKIDPEMYEGIIADVINRSANHAGWAEKQFINAPTVYLNQKRWTDEITQKSPGSATNRNQGHAKQPHQRPVYTLQSNRDAINSTAEILHDRF